VFSYTEGSDLCKGTYFANAIPVVSVFFIVASLVDAERHDRQINEQIAKQGYRLAAWLNEIFDGSTS
jgi:hypothetical protein